MFGTAVIVFRETLEAALFIGIMAAATRGLLGRGRWLVAGIVFGMAGALGLAAAAGQISVLADGVGQDLVNAGILAIALTMLAWHCIWVSNQGAVTAANARALGATFKQQHRAPWTLGIVVALSVLREGAETVLFISGYATGAGLRETVSGALLGILAGIVMGALIYFGLSRVPMKRIFAVTNILILLLAASIASQLARALAQAGLINSWGQPLWDSSHLIRADSDLGTLAHALVGYESRPTGLQLAFYLITMLIIVSGTQWVARRQTSSRKKSAAHITALA